MRRLEPHSREWYARQAWERGGYFHPWKRTLDGPEPESTFNSLLESLIGPTARVLEAGCGHGPDAARYAAQVARWTAYDRQPELLELARRNAPEAHLALWDGRGSIPAALAGPFDLIVSRRGPTSIVPHLAVLAAEGARFLYVGPGLDVPQIGRRLNDVGWVVLGEWRERARAWLPTEADYRLRCEFMNMTPDPDLWQREASGRGLPYFEERHTLLAAAE
ncbi:class I SAM-dependent methyltransferase [Deinococcus sp.]|uniref:class I SAM-dependent methyltransferase n=1 Tax=Deinococcus sp. TaxID=47478 RepID=UPI003C7A7480